MPFPRHVHDFATSYDHDDDARTVEIFTDGSHHFWDQSAGCGFVYQDDDDEGSWHCRSFSLGYQPGSIASRREGSRDAEKHGILLALDFVRSNWAITREVDVVRLRVDSTFALGDLAWQWWRFGGWNSRDRLENEIMAVMADLVECGIVVQMQYVQRGTARGNVLADEMAHIGRWAAERGDEYFVHFEIRT